MARKTRSGIVKTYVVQIVRNGKVEPLKFKAVSIRHADRVLSGMFISGDYANCYLLSPAERPKRIGNSSYLRYMGHLTGPGPFYSGVFRPQVETVKGWHISPHRRADASYLQNHRENLFNLFGPYSKQLLSNKSKHKERTRREPSSPLPGNAGGQPGPALPVQP